MSDHETGDHESYLPSLLDLGLRSRDRYWAHVDSGSSSDDLSLPKATVQKIVSEILPAQGGIAFAKEARDLLIECCVEFITLISSEANEISEKEAKKTIACDHITKALEQLGFSDYVPAVMEAAAEHKEVQKGREKKADKFANSGMSMEELARLQEEQFAQARQRHG